MAVLYIILLLTTVALPYTNGCDLVAFNTCLVPFLPYSTQAQLGITWTEDEIEAVCEVYDTAAECVVPTIADCDSQTKEVWKGVQNGYSYICNSKGKATYLKHRSCFAMPAVQMDLAECNSTFTAESKAAIQSSRILEQTCVAIKKFVNCSDGVIQDECGREASEFQHTLLSKFLEGTLSLINCKLDPLVFAEEKGGCDAEAFVGCMEPFQQYSAHAFVRMDWTEKKLEEICRSYDDLLQCVYDVDYSGCSQDIVGTLYGVDEAFGYLCHGPGKDRFLSHRTCLGSPFLGKDLRECNSTLVQEIESIDDITAQATREQACRAVNKFMNCTNSLTKDHCGPDAADFQWTFASNLAMGNLEVTNCSLTAPGDSKGHSGCKTEFECANREKCIPLRWQCDGERDCIDGSDEASCEKGSNGTTCDSAHFRCDNGLCVPLEFRCDGENDCRDNSDEAFCNNSTKCEEHQFRCLSGECIPLLFHCDHVDHCSDGSDETTCDCKPSSEYRCEIDGVCIPISWQCDGERDCVYGSDEAYCGGTVNPGCDLAGYMQCFAPFEPYVDEAQRMKWTPEELEKVCGVYGDFAVCAKPKMASCRLETAKIWTSIRDAFSFLCEGPGKSKYLENHACLGGPFLEKKLLQCNQTMTTDMEAAIAEAGSDNPKELKGTVCKLFNGYVSCTVGYTKEVCGKDAAEFYYTMLSDLMSGTLDAIDCDIRVTVDTARPGGPSSNTVGFIPRGSVLLTLGVLLMSVFHNIDF